MRIDNSIVVFVVHPKTKVPHRFVFPHHHSMHMAASEAMQSFGLVETRSPPLTLAAIGEDSHEFPFLASVTDLQEHATFRIVELEPKDD